MGHRKALSGALAGGALFAAKYPKKTIDHYVIEASVKRREKRSLKLKTS